MGLPLFVAPVESDLPSKAANKNPATSPSRTNIRRPGWRESRVAGARRTGSGLRLYGTVHRHHSDLEPLERPAPPRRAAVRLYGASRRELFPSDGPSMPWADAPLPPGFVPIDATEPAPRPFREALMDMSHIEERQRERLQYLLDAGMRSLNSASRDDERSPEYLGWITSDQEPPRMRFGRIPPPAEQRPDRGAERYRPNGDALPVPERPTLPRAPEAELNEEQLRAAAATRRIRRRLARSQLARRNLPPRRAVDGLGDRDRSLSPEVWDTLLSTLTPDPQPPSASTSFASGAASHSTVQSSTVTPGTVPSGEGAAEQPCESGCENSDGEDGDYEPPEPPRPPRRRRVIDEVGEYNLDGPADGPLDGPFGNPVGSRPGAGEGVRPSGWHSARIIHPAPLDGWVGRLSVGASDEEPGADGPRQNREGSAMSAHNASAGDEDLSGMQRIIRSLSWRQDIPEEWWAEAGLRRTLPPDTELTRID